MRGFRSPFGVFPPVFFLLALLALAAPAPLAAEGELVRALQSREDFLANQALKKTRANWLKLIKEFEDAAQAQPELRHASRARYLAAELAVTSGRRFGQKADYERADQLARRAVRDCPRCGHAAAAQLISGQALMALKQLDQADKQLMKVELNYPGSPEVAEARRLLAEIRGGPPPVPEDGRSARAETFEPVKPAPQPAALKPAAPKPEPANLAPAKPAVSKPAAERAERADRPAPPKARADGLAQVYFISLTDGGSHTTVTAYLDKVTSYVYNLIPPVREGGDFRAYADLKGAVIAPGARVQLKEKTSLVRLVKMNQYQQDVVRLVLDLPAAHPYRPLFLDKPPRLVFQVAKAADELPAPGVEAQPAPPEKAARASEPAPVRSPSDSGSSGRGPADSLARQLGLKVKCVVIDPGHGGKDNGASGNGLREKDLVLKLARMLETRVEKRLGLTVHLTRDEDKFITLERRTKIAADKKADLFVSLHVNANPLDKVQGFETYVLNFATDRSAMSVAARENASSDKSVAELEDVLKLIAKNTKVAESRAMAQLLHKSALSALNKKHQVRDLGVKEAPFYVLVGTNVPSILVEIGFITNEKEAARLGEDAYLGLIADGLCDGLASYVKGF